MQIMYSISPTRMSLYLLSIRLPRVEEKVNAKERTRLHKESQRQIKNNRFDQPGSLRTASDPMVCLSSLDMP